MTVYIEFVFVSNFIIDIFIESVTCIIIKSPFLKTRIIIAALIGSLIACIYPLCGNFKYLLAVLTAIVIPFVIVRNSNIKKFLTTCSVFLLVTAGLGGVVVGLYCLIYADFSFDKINYGVIPIITATSGLIFLIYCSVIKKNLIKIVKNNGLTYKVILHNDNYTCRCRAFYDSGNRVYTNYGEKVVIVSDRVYNKLMPALEELIPIVTPSGSSILKAVDAKIMIYFPSGANKIYNVKAGKSNNINSDFSVILHSEMTEEGDL